MTVLVAVLSGCSATGVECSVSQPSCALVLVVDGEEWTALTTRGNPEVDVAGAPVPAVEPGCGGQKVCSDGTTTQLGTQDADVLLRRIRGVPADQALVAPRRYGPVTVFVAPGVSTDELPAQVRRLVRR